MTETQMDGRTVIPEHEIRIVQASCLLFLRQNLIKVNKSHSILSQIKCNLLNLGIICGSKRKSVFYPPFHTLDQLFREALVDYDHMFQVIEHIASKLVQTNARRDKGGMEGQLCVEWESQRMMLEWYDNDVQLIHMLLVQANAEQVS